MLVCRNFDQSNYITTTSSATAEGPHDARVMLVKSCYVLRGMGARKVLNNKSDLQGHSKVLAMMRH